MYAKYVCTKANVPVMTSVMIAKEKDSVTSGWLGAWGWEGGRLGETGKKAPAGEGKEQKKENQPCCWPAGGGQLAS